MIQGWFYLHYIIVVNNFHTLVPFLYHILYRGHNFHVSGSAILDIRRISHAQSYIHERNIHTYIICVYDNDKVMAVSELSRLNHEYNALCEAVGIFGIVVFAQVGTEDR